MDTVLYKRPDSPYYWMRWYVGGKLYRQSTRTRSKKHATLIAKKKEEELLRNEGIIETETITLIDVIQIVIDDYKYNGKKTADKVKQRSNNLYKFFGEHKKITEINENDIDSYIKSRFDDGMKPSTINRELAVLKRGLNLLKKKHFIGSVPYIKSLQENNVRTGFLEHHEYTSLIKNASKDIIPVIQFAYKCGWRKSEILKLQWSMVDIDNGIITLPPGGYTKNGKGRVYYLDDELKLLFKRLWNEHTISESKCPYVFLNRSMDGPMLDFRTAWKNSCERAGIGKKLFHDLRRTAARNLVRSGVPERVAMKITGHLTRSTFERYNLVSDTDIKQAALKQQEYLNSQPTEKPEERPQEGIIPDVLFRSAKHGGDFVMWGEGNEIFPGGFTHFRRPTEKQWKAYLEYAVKQWGIDGVKRIGKEFEGNNNAKQELTWTNEFIESCEEK